MNVDAFPIEDQWFEALDCQGILSSRGIIPQTRGCWNMLVHNSKNIVYVGICYLFLQYIYIYSTLLPIFYLHMHNSPMMAHDWNQPAKSLCLYKIHWRKKTSVRLGLVSWWSQAIVCAGCAQRVTSTSNFINERVNWCFAVVSLPDVED